MRQIPYGQTNLQDIISENAYYVDKTSYIRQLEEAGKFLIFLRPRRFGKSLWLDTLADYYDVLNAPNFEKEFTGLTAGDYPTPEHSRYLVLRFNFSAVNKSGSLEDIQCSFADHCRIRIQEFIDSYSSFLPGLDREALDALSSPSHMLEALSIKAARCGHAIYVLIDEYDNFANAVLADSLLGAEGYRALTHGMGFFRNFFTFLKAGTTGGQGGIRRLFITGVSPLTLDDVTSGFNIGRNISTNPRFAGMLGMTEEEVLVMAEYYRKETGDPTPVEELMDRLRLWYNNYHFARQSRQPLSVYNTDMILYFFAEYVDNGGFPPAEMVDDNVKTDYGKLRQLIFWDRKLNGNFSALCDLAEGTLVNADLVTTFGLQRLGERDSFVSLLFYLGLVTIGGEDNGNLLFTIPNQTIRTLIYGFILDALRETPELNLDLQTVIARVRDMGIGGAWQAALDCLAELTFRTLSIRDLVVREKAPQLIHLVYLGLPRVFIIRSEAEAGHGYADLVLLPDRAHNPGVRHAYILEFKYLNAKDGAAPSPEAAEKAFQEAAEQLETYRRDPRLLQECGQATLHTIALAYAGPRLLDYRELPTAQKLPHTRLE